MTRAMISVFQPSKPAAEVVFFSVGMVAAAEIWRRLRRWMRVTPLRELPVSLRMTR